MKRLAVAAVAALGLFGCSNSASTPEEIYPITGLEGQYELMVPGLDCAYGIGDNAKRDKEEIANAQEELRTYFYLSILPGKKSHSLADTIILSPGGTKYRVPLLEINLPTMGVTKNVLIPNTMNILDSYDKGNEYLEYTKLNYSITFERDYIEYKYTSDKPVYLLIPHEGDEVIGVIDPNITVRIYHQRPPDSRCEYTKKVAHIVKMPKIEIFKGSDAYKSIKDPRDLKRLEMFGENLHLLENTVHRQR